MWKLGLLFSVIALHFSICHATSVQDGLSDALVKSEELPPSPLLQRLISAAASIETDSFAKQLDVLQTSLKTELLSPNTRTLDVIGSGIQLLTNSIFGPVSQIFGGILTFSLAFFKNILLETLIGLFATLNGLSFIRSIPSIYTPILTIYVGLILSNATLYLILNAVSATPDGFPEVLGTLLGILLGFIGSF